MGGYFLGRIILFVVQDFFFKKRSVFVNRKMDWKGTQFFTVCIVCFLKEKVCKGMQLPPNSLTTVFSINQSPACDI